MPRTYKPDLKSKPYKKYSQEDIQKALEDITNNKLSYREASKKYNINYSVLYRHLTRKGCIKSQGGQPVLSKEEEEMLIDRLVICAEWGYPMDIYDLRLIVKHYLDSRGKTVKRFNNNMPGRDYAIGFLKRHKNSLSFRMCQNIKRARAQISPDIIKDYFDKLRDELIDVPPSHIINFDETNLSDDPGRKKIITKRGCKYPQRVLNESKSATSIMFAAAADGTLLPSYVVYKSKNLYHSWTEGGPKGVRYNRTKSGWFDSFCFDDWVKNIALPYCTKLDGKKILIGDNLSSHLSTESIKMCSDHNIRFVFLPSNSTHLTQPLDIAFFRPLKSAWRSVLESWKKGPGRKETCVPKDVFPRLLVKLLEKIEFKNRENIKAGFRKGGIVPFNPEEVLKMLPAGIEETKEGNVAFDSSFVKILESLRYGDTRMPRRNRKKLHVEPGRSVSVPDESSGEADEPEYADDMSEEDSASESRENQNKKSLYEITDLNSIDNTKHFTKEDMEEGDWVLVCFPCDGSKATSSKQKDRLFVGEIVRKKSTKFTGRFLRGKPTKNFNGYVYQYPNVPDECDCNYSQVKSKLENPEQYCRGLLKFKLDWHDL